MDYTKFFPNAIKAVVTDRTGQFVTVKVHTRTERGVSRRVFVLFDDGQSVLRTVKLPGTNRLCPVLGK